MNPKQKKLADILSFIAIVIMSIPLMVWFIDELIK